MTRLRVRLGLLATAAALVALAVSGPAQAAQTFTVTNLSDSGVSGDGSLRGEVLAANASPGADTINFAGGLGGNITLSGEGLRIKDPVDIEGPGPGQITVAQSSEKRVIYIDLTNHGPVAIAGLHIAGGTASSGPGGNILNDFENPASPLTIVNSLITGGTASDYGGGIGGYGASLTLSSTTLSGNHATSGGGAWVGGDGVAITVENSTFSGNSTSGSGGALTIELLGGSALVTGTTFSGNQAQTYGGAIIASASKGNTTIANSTIFGNSSATNGGGGIDFSTSEGTTLVEASTVSGNQSTGPGAKAGGILVSNKQPARLEDTIVAGNSADAGGADLDGPIDAAFSLIGSPSGATLTETVAGSNLIGADPQLGPLQNNGGPTETMAITASSAAVNKGAGGLGADQRGQLRPVAYPGVPFSAAAGANGADIGAFELQAPLPVVPSNRFHFGKVKLNKKKGTATVAVIVPGPGSMRLVGSKKVKKASKTAKIAGTVKLLLKAKGKALSTLKSSGKVKVKAKFTFAPTGGTPASKTKVVKLVRTRRGA